MRHHLQALRRIQGFRDAARRSGVSLRATRRRLERSRRISGQRAAAGEHRGASGGGATSSREIATARWLHFDLLQDERGGRTRCRRAPPPGRSARRCRCSSGYPARPGRRGGWARSRVDSIEGARAPCASHPSFARADQCFGVESKSAAERQGCQDLENVRYSDGEEPKAGDTVRIGIEGRGTVVACIDSSDYLPGHEQWAYLEQGLMIDTDFGGLVHYTSEATDELVLLHRAANPGQISPATEFKR